jgi:hypothetical protein
MVKLAASIPKRYAKNFRIKDDHQNTENNVKTMRLRAVNQQNEAGESNDDASA